MSGVGGPEVLVILLVALLVFGPRSLPGVARTVGKGMRELRRLTTEFQREVNLADALDEEQRVSGPARVSKPRAGPDPAASPSEAAPKPPPDQEGGAR